MTTENKRDLTADLAICEAATAGPWSSDNNRHPELSGKSWGSISARNGVQIGTWSGSRNANYSPDNRYITEAREGWPEAIRRAMAAEAEVERLRSTLEMAQFHLDREQYMSASDTVDSALEVSLNGSETTQENNGR